MGSRFISPMKPRQPAHSLHQGLHSKVLGPFVLCVCVHDRSRRQSPSPIPRPPSSSSAWSCTWAIRHWVRTRVRGHKQQRQKEKTEEREDSRDRQRDRDRGTPRPRNPTLLAPWHPGILASWHRILAVEPLAPNCEPLSGLRKTLCQLANRCDRRDDVTCLDLPTCRPADLPWMDGCIGRS